MKGYIIYFVFICIFIIFTSGCSKNISDNIPIIEVSVQSEEVTLTVSELISSSDIQENES